MSYIKINDQYKISNGSITIIENLQPEVYVVRFNEDAYVESLNETDYIDVMEMIENDGLEFISFSKSLF